MNTLLLGEWLNGRVAVSKTVGCVFESRLPCQIVYCLCDTRFFYIELLFVSVRAFSHAKVASDAIRPFGQESLFRRFAPYESRLPCQFVYCLCDTRFFCTELLLLPLLSRERSHMQRLRLTRSARSGRNRCSVASLLTNHDLPCQFVYCAPGGIFRDQQKLNNNGSFALISLFFRRSPQTRPLYGKIRAAMQIPRPEDSTTARYKRLFRLRGAIKADYEIL